MGLLAARHDPRVCPQTPTPPWMKRSRIDSEDLSGLITSTKPQCVVFDLDHTLWDGNVESFQDAKLISQDEAVSTSSGHSLHLYAGAREVFSILASHRVPLAIASASPATVTAKRLLRAFNLPRVAFAEVHPGKKDVHLRAIQNALKVPLDRCLFFDDLAFNIKTAEALGVGGCVLVRGGVDADDLRRALRLLSERTRSRGLLSSWLAGGARSQSMGGSTSGNMDSVSEGSGYRASCGGGEASGSGASSESRSVGLAPDIPTPILEPVGTGVPAAAVSSLSAEQRARVDQNKRLALERRAAKDAARGIVDAVD